MDTKKLERFYTKLLSSVWSERLEAYERIALDLKSLGCSVFSENMWVDFKLLAGQIISIHFKRRVKPRLDEFSEKLASIYSWLLSPLKKDASENYRDSMQLLTDIYDDDDEAAQCEIKAFFHDDNAIDRERSVIDNLFRCYATMMCRVQNRAASFVLMNEALPA